MNFKDNIYQLKTHMIKKVDFTKQKVGFTISILKEFVYVVTPIMGLTNMDNKILKNV